MDRQKKSKQTIPKKYFIVDEAIFNRTVHVFINYSHKEFAEWARKQGDTTYTDDETRDYNFMGFSTEITETNKLTDWVICLNHFNWTLKDQGSLIHEIVHTIVKIWKMNNIPFTPDNQEFLAHSVGNLYEDIAGKIFNLKKVKNDKA